jgi:hypothetical protein
VQHHDDVRTRGGLDGRRDAWLQVVTVDEFELDLGAQRLAGIDGLALELDVAGRNEVHPAQDVKLGALREGGRPVRGDNAGDSGHLEERAALHRLPPRHPITHPS